MRERLFIQNNDIDLASLIEGQQTELVPTGVANQLMGKTRDGTVWHLQLNSMKTDAKSRPTNHRPIYDAFFDFCRANRSYSIAGKSQSFTHIQTVAFITGNWPKVISHLENGAALKNPDYSLFCCAEVAFGNPDKHGQRFSVDCVGAGSCGNIYVVEVGRHHKIKQLTEQLHKLQRLYPELQFDGVLAYYRFNNHSAHINFLSL